MIPPRVPSLLLLVLLPGVLVLGCAPFGDTRADTHASSGRQPGAPSTGRAVRPEQRPNILLITTDDQNTDDLRFMPHTRRLLARTGTSFTQAISPHPLCCPARAEILTGQYAQNNGVKHNHGLFGGFPMLDVRQTLGTWLQKDGYRTAFVGKFLNEYGEGGAVRVPGWNIWEPIVSHFYDYHATTFFHRMRSTGRPYTTDKISDRTVAYLRRLVARKAPFFLWASHVAPHGSPTRTGLFGPPRVSPRDAHVLGSVRAPSLRARSFDVPGDGSAGLVGQARTWTPDYVQHFYTQRIRALQSADRAVARAVRLLRRLGQLDNTYVFFASDNGFLLAQHRLIGKNVLYEENLRVPLLVRGPAVQHQRSALPVTLVDLAPTILEIAGASSGVRLDGRSFLGDLRGRRIPWRDSQLIQTGRNVVVRDGSHGWTFRGVRTGRYTYGRDVLTGQRLLFDRRADPAELHNVVAVPAYQRVAAELERRTRLLTSCSGRSCNRSFGPVVEPLRASGAR